MQLIRNAATQFLGQKYSLLSDNYIVSVVELFRIMTRFAELANPAIVDSRRSRDVSLNTVCASPSAHAVTGYGPSQDTQSFL